MADPKKIANNILDFLIDPTKVPVKERVYFRPEENLKNDVYEGAKAEAAKVFKDQKFNSDFYPNKTRKTQREAMLMDRKSLIASFDILSRNFKENDLIAKDLRTMAAAVSKMSEEEFSGRQASDAPDFEEMKVEAKAKTFKCPKCGTKVLEQTGYCVKCKKKVKKAAEEESPVKDEEVPEKEETPKDKGDDVEATVQDFWTKEAMTRVAQGLVTEVLAMEGNEEDEEAKDDKEAKKEEKAPEEEEVSAKKEKVLEEEEMDKEAKKKIKIKYYPDGTIKKEKSKEKSATVDEEEKDVAKAKDVEEEVKEANKKAAITDEKSEEKLPVDEEKKSTVDTDILASITFGDISLDAPIIEAGEMTEEEKAKLAGLFN
jgi:hypothetical protein